jgi:signal transduction histidine kinase
METIALSLIIVQSLVLLIITVILFYSLHKMSKIKKHEEALVTLQSKQNDFIPILVHELRAPLSVIHGASDLLLKEVKGLSVEQIQNLLTQIKSSSSSMLKMVADILDVSKMDAGKFEVNKVYASINNVLKEECGYFQSLAQLKNIKFDVQLDPKLNHTSFDPDRIKQVLNNFLSNALKYTSEGGVVTVSSKQAGNDIQVAVADSGIGIADADKQLLFHKFAQAESHNHIKEKGTGLGLYIAKNIVEAHKGRIWVEDNKPVGSKFIFSIPQA